MKNRQTLRSFVLLCIFWRTEFPEFWNCWKICFAYWGTNSFCRTERILSFTFSRRQHQACNCTVLLSTYLGEFVAVPSQLARFNLLPKNTQWQHTYFYSIKICVKKMLFILPLKIKLQSKMNLLWGSPALFPKKSWLHSAAQLCLWRAVADRVNSFTAVN